MTQGISLLLFQVSAGAMSSMLLIPCKIRLTGKVANLFERSVLVNEGNRFASRDCKKSDFTRNVIYIPFAEELFFRGGCEAAMTYYFEHQNHSFPILASALSVSLLFCAMHFNDCGLRLGLTRATHATLSGLHYSLLKNSLGMPAAIAAHIVNNWDASKEIERTSTLTSKEHSQS